MQRHMLLRAVSAATRQARQSRIPSRQLCTAVSASKEATTPTEETSAIQMSPRVSALLDDLVSLNMLEVRELTNGLKDRLGIEDTATMPIGFNPAAFAGMGGGAASADGPAEEKKPEKTHFDLKLEKFDAGKKIAVIKQIRTITALGLKEAKALVEEAPKVFKTNIAKEEAEQIRDKLKEIGGDVILE